MLGVLLQQTTDLGPTRFPLELRAGPRRSTSEAFQFPTCNGKPYSHGLSATPCGYKASCRW
jgi:hypothetical protein